MGEINKYGYVRFGSGLMAVQKKKSGPSLNDLQNNEYREESPNVSTPTIKLIERSRTRKIDLMVMNPAVIPRSCRFVWVM
ncbi:hypothetical protein ABFS83_12G057900 [Erythranthe nasuta]